jgi:2-polyprenyl-6-methoxyphenol hydroxylase-like FAD-dependent oxidoreductase
MTNFEVLIIGGGIGGLTLAHGLRRAGIRVEVHERTHERTDWLQGYRIHISPAGARALHDCLPPPNWQAFLDTAAPGGDFGLLTDQGAELLGLEASEINHGAGGPADRHYGVSRVLLRSALLDGLDDVLHLGHEFTGYELTGDRVTAHFADGSKATADLLIGADGANSRVRAQLLPHAAGRHDTGVVAIAGKHPLPADLPPLLSSRANIVIPRGRGSLFTAVWQQDPATGYVLWGYSDAAARLPADVTALDGAALSDLVRRRLAGWSPDFLRLIDGSDHTTVNAFPVRSAIPVTPWPTGRVTLLGDAIHNMTPMAGIGANTALRDADLLRRRLTAADLSLSAAGDLSLPAAGDSSLPAAGDLSLAAAVHGYEVEMLDYGFAAVRRSLRNARQSATSTRLSRAAFRTTLRVIAAIPPIRRAVARNLGR